VPGSLRGSLFRASSGPARKILVEAQHFARETTSPRRKDVGDAPPGGNCSTFIVQSSLVISIRGSKLKMNSEQ
jgi:hypothetical protein